MHSTLVRAQNVFGFFTTVAFCIGALVALSVVISPQTPSATVELRNVQVVKGRPHYYSNKKEEYAHIKFDLDADFSSLFTWNTKQLFIYILASYPSTHASTPPSRAIIWDLIIPSPLQQHPYSPLTILGLSPSSSPLGPLFAKNPSPPADPPGTLHLPNTRPKYQITDISGRFARRENVTLEVGWNVQPWVGALMWTRGEGEGWGWWQGVRGGRSREFNMPGLKGRGRKEEEEEVVGGKEGGVPEAAEARPVVGV